MATNPNDNYGANVNAPKSTTNSTAMWLIALAVIVLGLAIYYYAGMGPATSPTAGTSSTTTEQPATTAQPAQPAPEQPASGSATTTEQPATQPATPPASNTQQ